MMNNQIRICRLLTALLVLCVLFACTAGTALADEFKGYVASIGIVAADTEAEAKEQLEGHTVLDMDLNKGTNSGKRIYMGYKTTMDPDEAIYGFGIFESNSDSATSWGGTFHAVGSSGESNTAGGGKVNLNEGAGGKTLHLAVTRDKGFNDVPVTGIQLSHDINPSEDYPRDACGYTLDTAYGTSDRPHLNQDASGGSAIYLYYQRFIDMDTGVALTAYYLSGSGAIQTGNVGKWLTNASETVTFSAQPTTVTYNDMSYAFAGWHDDKNAAGAPENTSTTATAGMGSLGSTNYQSRYAAYKHDLKLSFNANGGTGAPAAVTRTQYLNLSQTKVRPQSVSFTIPSTAPTHSDATRTFYRWCTSADGAGTTYAPGDTITLTEDTTLYALWTVGADNCTVELSRYNYVDNGTERKPDVTVKHNGSFLSSQYYDVEYSNNTAPGTAKVTVNLEEPYTGTLTAYFHIADFKCDAQPRQVAPPKEDETATVTLRGYLDGVEIPADDPRLIWEVMDYSINGATINGNTLTIRSNVNTDEVLCRAIYDNESVGTVWVYIGILELPAFQLDTITANFDGMEHRPQIAAYNTPMVEGEDYTVKYLRDGVETTDFISAGNITVEVTGINDYQGTDTSGFTIKQAQMSSTQFVGFQDTFLYNGYPQKPEITLELPNGYRLKEGRDYTLSYTRDNAATEDFTSVGTIRVTATAVPGGNFGSSRYKSYTIRSNDISTSINITTPGTIIYDGQPHGVVSVQVNFHDETLTEGEDYTVTYKRDGEVTDDLAGAGIIEVEVAGAGRYAGFKSKSYTIKPKTITADMVTVTPESAVWNGSAQKPEVTVSGILPGDYAVTYKRGDEVTDDFTDCGEITVTVAPANGNCTGTVSKGYVINHHPDMACGHAGEFALKYQAKGSDEVVFSNDLASVCGNTSPLMKTGGVVTLLKPITLDATLNVWVPDLTIDLNGNSITFTDTNDSISNYEGTLTIEGPGSVITRNRSPLYSNSKPFVLIGDVTLDYAMSDYEYAPNILSGGNVDLTQYTGGDLLIRSTSSTAGITVQVNDATHELLAYTPKKASNGNVLYDQPGFTGATIAYGELGQNSWAKLVRKHAHSWSFSLNESKDAIVAVCSGSGDCPVDNNTATIRLTAPTDLTYDGQPKEVTVTQTPAGFFTDLPAVGSCCEGGCVNAGEHTQALTYGRVTAKKTFTIAPMDIAGAEVSPFDEMTYSGAAQTPKAAVTLANGMTVTGAWSSVTNVSDTTTFTASGNFTGTIADRETGMLKATPAASDFAFAPPANPVYDGHEKAAGVTTDKTGMGEILISYYRAGETEPVTPREAGEYRAVIAVAEGENYLPAMSLQADEWKFTIAQAQTALTAQTDRTVYTYGDTITVTGTAAAPQRTGLLRLFASPAARQAALYDAGGTQLTEPVDVVNGEYTITYDTAEKGVLPAKGLRLTVGFVGDGSLSDQTALTNAFTLSPRSLTPALSGSASKPYDGTAAVTEHSGLALSAAGVLGSDHVVLSGSYAYDNAGAGTGKTVYARGVALSGADAPFYTLSADTAGAAVGEITRAQIAPRSGSLSVANNQKKTYTYDLSQLLPALDGGRTYGGVSYQLGAISLGSHYAGGASISGSALSLPIEAVRGSGVDLGTVSVSITSGNYAFTADAVITVKEGAQVPQIEEQPVSASYLQGDQNAHLKVKARVTDGGRLTYQWYSNTVRSHTGGTPISGADGANYKPSTEAVGTVYYYCVVTNTNDKAAGEKTASAASDAATVTVLSAAAVHDADITIIGQPDTAYDSVRARLMPLGSTAPLYDRELTAAAGTSPVQYLYRERAADGLYNLVITAEEANSHKTVTVTTLIDLQGRDDKHDVRLPEADKSSVVADDTGMGIIVGSVENAASDQALADPKGHLEVMLAAKPGYDPQTAAQDAPRIEQQAGEDRKEIEVVLDIDLTLHQFDADGREISETNLGSRNKTHLEILIPVRTAGRAPEGFAVYRVHNGELQKLPYGAGDEYFTVDIAGEFVKLHVKRFSSYAIGYSEPVPPSLADLPQTGDNSRLALWLMLMSAAGAAALLLRRRARS